MSLRVQESTRWIREHATTGVGTLSVDASSCNSDLIPALVLNLSYHTSPSSSDLSESKSHPLVELVNLNLQSRHYEIVSEINAIIGQRSRWSNAMNRFE